MNAVLALDPIRDGRYRSRMAPETVPVDELLATWGKWARNGLAHLGLPRQAAFVVISGRSTAPTDMPDYLLEVERAVLTLPDIRRRVLIEHYTYWQPVEVSARNCHMSCARFRKLLEQARKIIARTLDASHTYR